MGMEKTGDMVHMCFAYVASKPYLDGDILQNKNLLNGMKFKVFCDAAMAMKVALVTAATSVIAASFWVKNKNILSH